jgi:hypothetical protein
MSYIGVTGFTDRQQVREALSLVPSDATRSLMVGVLASQKTLYRTEVNPRCPRREDISSIFVEHVRALNLVHYFTQDTENLHEQLWDAITWGGPLCHGVQINIAWPDTEVLEGLHRSKPSARVVLQIGRQMMSDCDFDAAELATRVIGEYGGLVHYMLVDASGGAGIALDLTSAATYLVELRQELERIGLEDTGLVVAGGLDAQAVHHQLPILNELVERLGIDAESRLRDDAKNLSMDKVAAYIQQAYRVLDP